MKLAEVQKRLQRVMAPMEANLFRRGGVITPKMVRALTDEAARQVVEMTDGDMTLAGVRIGLAGTVTYIVAGGPE